MAKMKDVLRRLKQYFTKEAQDRTSGDSTLNTKIEAETTRATGVESGLDTRVGDIENDYLKASDKTELNSAIQLRALTTETGNKIDLEIDSTNFKVVAKLYDKNNTLLSTSNEIDLPLESVVVSGSYDSINKKVILTLENGSTIEFSVADLIYGLQSEITSNNPLSSDLVSDDNNAHKFVSANEKNQITTNKNDIANIKDGVDIDSFKDVEEALDDKQNTIDVDHKLSANLIEENTNKKFVSEDEKTTWNAKAEVSDIPTALSDLDEDSTHRTVTDDEKTTWNGKQEAISDLEAIRSGASAGASAVQDSNYVHTDNNYTTAEKNKLAGVEAGAQVNPTNVSAFNNDAGYITDVSGKLDKSGGTMTGRLTFPENGNATLLRNNPNYYAGINYRTAGNEAVCFENKNSVTSWIFRTYDPTSANNSYYTDVTPAMQIKNQRVTINKLIADGSDGDYNLDVNGTAHASGDVYIEGVTTLQKLTFFRDDEIDRNVAGDIWLGSRIATNVGIGIPRTHNCNLKVTGSLNVSSKGTFSNDDYNSVIEAKSLSSNGYCNIDIYNTNANDKWTIGRQGTDGKFYIGYYNGSSWNDNQFQIDTVTGKAYLNNNPIVTGTLTYDGDNNPDGHIMKIDNMLVEGGRYYDWHYDNTAGLDYSCRLQIQGNYKNTINLPIGSGTLALTSDIPHQYRHTFNFYDSDSDDEICIGVCFNSSRSSSYSWADLRSLIYNSNQFILVGRYGSSSDELCYVYATSSGFVCKKYNGTTISSNLYFEDNFEEA